MSDLGTVPVQAALLACLLAGTIGPWVARDAWIDRHEPGGVEVAGYLVAGSLVSLLYALRVVSEDPAVMSFTVQASTPLLATLPLLWICFAFAYAGHDRWRTERRIAAIAAPAVVWILLAWSSRTHGLAWHSFEPIRDGPFTLLALGLGPAGVAFLSYAAGLYLAGVLIVVDVYRRTGNRYRLQTFLVLLGTLVLAIAGIVTGVDLGSFGSLEWTPAAFVVHGVFLYGSVFWLGTLDAGVAARDTAVEVMQDPVIVSGADGRIRDLNPAAERVLTSGAVGSSLTEVIPGTAMHTDEPIPIRGRQFDVQLDPIRDPRGTDRGHVLLLRDVTEQERRQRELERRETQLERQNERLEGFAGVVSHDLRNPLAAATAAVELVRHGDGKHDAALERATNAHERMDDLIGGLLSLATAGRTVDAVEPVSVDPAVRTAWSRLETGTGTLEVDAKGVTIRADPDRFQQLMSNLFRNAVEHGGENVTVRVSATIEDAVRIRVADDGPGIPPADRSRIFDRGVSLSDGTGLGLSIVSDIAGAHGWTVGVVSGSLDGACFEIGSIESGETSETVEPCVDSRPDTGAGERRPGTDADTVDIDRR